MQADLTKTEVVTNIGLELFGDLIKFQRWLDTESYALGSVKPSSLLDDVQGRELVAKELTNISHGIFV